MVKILVYGWPKSQKHTDSAELFDGTDADLARILKTRGGPSDATTILLEEPPANHQKFLQRIWNWEQTNGGIMTASFIGIYARAFEAGWNAHLDLEVSSVDWRYFIVPDAATVILLEEEQEPVKNKRIKKEWRDKGIIGHTLGADDLWSGFALTQAFNPRTATSMRTMIEESCWNGYCRRSDANKS